MFISERPRLLQSFQSVCNRCTLPLISPGTLTHWATALHFHGGNFTLGSKELLVRYQAEKLVDLGFVVVSANYRLSPTVTVFEGAVKDALDAYRWAQTKLPELLSGDAGVNVDGSRIVTWGHSCGATLALLTVRGYLGPIFDLYASWHGNKCANMSCI